MTATVLTALLLGTAAGIAPGPYTTMVVGTALERGFRPASRLALAPFVTDVPPLIVTALILERLSGFAMSALGAFGGIVVIYIGYRFLRQFRAGVAPVDPEHPGAAGQSARFWHVALGTLVSPVPWLFWLVVGSPLMLRSWERSPAQGMIFIALVFVTNISTATALAYGASHGRRVLAVHWQRRLLGAVGAVLVLAGCFLVYRAATGDFQSLIDRQESFRIFVEDRVGSP